MLSPKAVQSIENAPLQLQKPVRLVLFLSDAGAVSGSGTMELCRAIKAKSAKIALETYDIVMDRDKSEQYGVRRAPALVVQGMEGPWAIFSGSVEDAWIEVLLKAIVSLSLSTPWFPDDVERALRHLTDGVPVLVFTGKGNTAGAAVADIAVGMALSSGLVETEVVNAASFPEAAAKAGVGVLPTTLFGDRFRIEGAIAVSEFLEMLFQAQGTKPGPDRKCLVCGSVSEDTICMKCKTRIQAEAVEHKLKSEKTMRSDTP